MFRLQSKRKVKSTFILILYKLQSKFYNPKEISTKNNKILNHYFKSKRLDLKRLPWQKA